MQTRTRTMTVAEFRTFTELPENRDKDFELLEGEVIEVPSPKEIHAWIVGEIAFLLRLFLRTQGIEGTVYHDNLDFVLSQNIVLKPDVSYTSAARKPKLLDYPVVAPDLVVEVVSPSNTLEEFEAKMKNYFEHGTQVVWLVYPKTRTIHVYVRGEILEKPTMFILTTDDTITGGDALPGFTAKVSDFFPNLPLADDAL
jgi:Uma2 family endonuclease